MATRRRLAPGLLRLAPGTCKPEREPDTRSIAALGVGGLAETVRLGHRPGWGPRGGDRAASHHCASRAQAQLRLQGSREGWAGSSPAHM